MARGAATVRRTVSEADRIARRGGVGLWSFVAHRATGVVLVGFFAFVVLDFAFVLAGADAYDGYRDLYGTASFRLAEIAVLAALLYHALNGVRTVVVDLVPGAARRHRDLFNVQTGVFFALFVPGAWVLVARFAL